MRNEPHTFPTIRSWQRMSERQQDAMLDKIETRRRRRSMVPRLVMGALFAAAVMVAVYVVAF
jgi:hypothetical protein